MTKRFMLTDIASVAPKNWVMPEAVLFQTLKRLWTFSPLEFGHNGT
jgi:hypothetical protein